MAAKRPLKVFRTSIGFADAYIAAPSQKAALAAWGADGNLFAQGMAEVVTDPQLAAPALASPGTVLRVAKGTTADYLAATKVHRREEGSQEASKAAPKPAKPKPKPKPRPSRQKLDEARAALEHAHEEQDRQRAEIDARIEQLRAERARAQAKAEADMATLQARVDREDKAYRQALDRWEG